MKREFGTQMGVDYRSKIETIDKPYAFIKFERQITKKKSEYRDFGSNKQLSKSLLDFKLLTMLNLISYFRCAHLPFLNRQTETQFIQYSISVQ